VAVDLVRIAGSAYLADRLSARPAAFSRRLRVRVGVTTPAAWEGEPATAVADLLAWLTGDAWDVDLMDDHTPRPDAALEKACQCESVALLSGGMDSFLGAVYLVAAQPDRLSFLGHKDSATAVRQAQSVVEGWMRRSYSPPPSYTRLAFAQAMPKKEASSRSRSLLFMAMGTALASASQASTLYVPENGFTSLNLPLHPNRGGALSTRSTHPETFHRFNGLLQSLGIEVEVKNPFAWLTKGEAARQVAASRPPEGWLDAAAQTISCSKLDGGRIKGGAPNLNCGLCYPCVVRRAAFMSGGIPDRTKYLSDELAGDSRDILLQRRFSDRQAIAYATARGVDEEAIDAGVWPDDIDLDAVSSLAQRGLEELKAVGLR
jgi:7-cyano-7-deazaguanine synthase in queuosine biosynthesis